MSEADPARPPSESDAKHPLKSEMMEPLHGVENYQVGSEIATGGMGSILEAEDSKLNRSVAIKVMLLEADANEPMRRRFLREAKVLAMLSHPNIVPIYDIVWEDGMPLFYSMKLVKGRTLQAILDDLRNEVPEVLREFTLERLLFIFRKVCDAIAFTHSKGVLHRDLKPENIMVGEFGEVLVMDWGLAKWMTEDPDDALPSPLINEGSAWAQNELANPFHATMHGSVLGTPQYMSPEQAKGEIGELDARSDIYTLGGILYSILTLHPPIEGHTEQEILEKVTSGQISVPSRFKTTFRGKRKPFEKGSVKDAKLAPPLPHLQGRRVPPSLSSVAMKALHLDKAQRYFSVNELNAEIEAYQSGYAPNAEQAGTMKQFHLLMLRHQTVTASLLVLLAISIGFVVQLLSSERRATQNAEIAAANAQSAIASAEESQRSLAKAQIALAAVAYNQGSLSDVTTALNVIPLGFRDQSWNYYKAKCDSSLGHLEIPGFCEHVTDVCAVPHQPGQFAIASQDGRIGIVDVVSKKLLRSIDTGHAGELRISISGDGTRLLSRSSSAPTADFYDLTTGKKLNSFPVSRTDVPQHPYLQTVALNVSGKLAALPEFNRKELSLIDTATGKVLCTLPFQPMQMIFHPNGKTLLIAQHENYALHFIRLTDGKTVGRPRLFAYPQSMSLSPAGDQLMIGLISGDVEQFNGVNLQPLTRKRISTKPIDQIAWTAGGNMITLDGSGANDQASSRTLHLWHPEDVVPVGYFFGLTSYPGNQPLSVNHSSGHILTSQSPPQLWLIPDQPTAAIQIGTDLGWSCQFMSDTVLLARQGNYLNEFDLSNPRLPMPTSSGIAKEHLICKAHLSPDLLATAFPCNINTDKGQALTLWQSTPAGLVQKWSIPAIGTDDCTIDLDFDPLGQRLLRSTSRNHIEVFSVATGQRLVDIPYPVHRAAFAGTHGFIIAISGRSSQEDQPRDNISVIDPKDGSVQTSLDTDTSFRDLAVSPDLRLIALGTNDAQVLILDADTLEEKYRFHAHDNFVSALRFHPTKPILATGSEDHTIKLWDYITGHLRQSFVGIRGHPRTMDFSPDGRLLAIDGRHYFIRIFELEPKPIQAKSAPTTTHISLLPNLQLDQGSIGDSCHIPLGNKQEVLLKYVPAGDFIMGSPITEGRRSTDENQVKVSLSHHFWMAETELTEEQWQAVTGRNPELGNETPNLPITKMSCDLATSFITKLNNNYGLPKGWQWALPTEAQWERACRASTETIFNMGNTLSGKEANFQSARPYASSQTLPWPAKRLPVKSFAPNAYGLYDMHGNIVEWCQDWYADHLTGGTDPQGPTTGYNRVLRGGGWNRDGFMCRSAAREFLPPQKMNIGLGLRLAIVHSE